jgi:sugar (pentulose or hexulose) kinase
MADNDLGQLAYSISHSHQSQEEMRAAGQALLSNIEQRASDRARLAASYFADGVSDPFQDIERLWQRVAEHVRAVMAQLESTLGESDGIASSSMSKASTAVQSIRV